MNNIKQQLRLLKLDVINKACEVESLTNQVLDVIDVRSYTNAKRVYDELLIALTQVQQDNTLMKPTLYATLSAVKQYNSRISSHNRKHLYITHAVSMALNHVGRLNQIRQLAETV